VAVLPRLRAHRATSQGLGTALWLRPLPR
jgi:hypothetical protein